MGYSPDVYTGDGVPDFESTVIENAVPGYWEDMGDMFFAAPFYRELKVNPSFGNQKYPIASTAPDMALPNYMGNFYYKKTFEWNAGECGLSLFFGGVQNTVRVWINDFYIGCHKGYSTPFELSVPMGIVKTGANTVVLSVSNLPMAGAFGMMVTGLTNRAANEYTGGITGDVELRYYTSPLRDAYVFVNDDLSMLSVKICMTQKETVSWELMRDGSVIKKGTAMGDFDISTDGLELWSPENPVLYNLRIYCGDGVCDVPVGVRKLLSKGEKFDLNGKPYFLRGVCEHCYFPDTIHPAHDLDYYKKIIKNLKELGFNFIRFHTYIPEEEYMQAADELGMLLHVESPNNTTLDEWGEIAVFCRRHPSVVIYCCGNELLLDDRFIDHLEQCSMVIHSCTDALFSPMSAMRGVEYYWEESNLGTDAVNVPFAHNPSRMNKLGGFSDMYSSYSNGFHSYEYLDVDPKVIDSWGDIYKKPRVSHEICIDGTYTDLSLECRYDKLRVGKTAMFPSIREHLKSKGVLDKAPLYFKNSSQWQRRVRKFCFESTRMSNRMAGYDFLGPIDTHWHTFGYDVGMMNEFYELKPGETVKNVLMYNSPTVILNDLGLRVNFESGEHINGALWVSHYGNDDLDDATLTLRLFAGMDVIYKESVALPKVKNGEVTKLYDMDIKLADVRKPQELRLYVTLDDNGVFVENEWELYLFPKAQPVCTDGIIISEGMSADELKSHLADGHSVILFGSKPFKSLETSFRIGLAGRCSGNVATVLYDHPVLKDMPHEGYCGWQFASLMEGGSAVCFESMDVPFDPIAEVVSTHKYVIRQSSLFELSALGGKLLVCTMNFDKATPASAWLKEKIVSYASGSSFNPRTELSGEQLDKLIYTKVTKAQANTNFAFNLNDKASLKVEG